MHCAPKSKVLAAMLCGWGVQAGARDVWVPARTVGSYHGPLSERFTVEFHHSKALYKLTVLDFTFLAVSPQAT